jgi:hypothetical protein
MIDYYIELNCLFLCCNVLFWLVVNYFGCIFVIKIDFCSFDKGMSAVYWKMCNGKRCPWVYWLMKQHISVSIYSHIEREERKKRSRKEEKERYKQLTNHYPSHNDLRAFAIWDYVFVSQLDMSGTSHFSSRSRWKKILVPVPVPAGKSFRSRSWSLQKQILVPVLVKNILVTVSVQKIHFVPGPVQKKFWCWF